MNRDGSRAVAPRPEGNPTGEPQDDPDGAGNQRTYLRGSSLLVGGRLISVLLNFSVQVITVRYLAKNDYGAFAYALAVVSMLSSSIHLGMDKALPRLIPIYVERDDYRRAFGSIWLATATIWGLGLSLLFMLIGFHNAISGSLVTDPQALSLLLILIVLAPVQAYTSALEKLVAVFADARDIFVRRHIVGPGLKLAVVLLVVFTAGNVEMLAWGYLIGGGIGAGLYVTILLRQWRQDDLLGFLRPGNITAPVRELFGFSLPLLSSDVLLILRTSLVVILLEYFITTAAVAEYRAVLSVAKLNLIVYEAFYLLFVPVASRMYARNDGKGINELYWKTARWITAFTFPPFLVTCSLAEPVTVLLYGDKYAGAGILLTILAAGHFIHAAFGFNTAVLQVYGKLRLIVIADVAAALGAIGLCLVLIPLYGAMGAAVATASTLVLRNLFHHLSLWIGGVGIRLLEPRFLRVYGFALLALTVMLLVENLAQPPLPVSLGFAAVLSVAVFGLARRDLDIAETFPELARIPVIRRLVT